MFKCKTKGNVSPQGKRRVYFTCHPDDYDRFFEKISAEILKFLDCAIWYSTDDNYENIDTDLGQMNLFVIPITTKLLTKPCRTMELDVPFALEKHIPILPLMQEDSLDELFTHHFGDLQYLNPNAHDITAISYEDKLKKYLNSVLVSDEMAEKVRAAFDAYIFLSYRKKDRKYANELMRLIHQNDFCRDIAIWYDEYLVPGEDFNNAITEALKKSDLFAMVITPNLVNETNYVQTKEYPAAVKQNKTIIPTELEKTDYKALSEKYPNIPNSIDAHDKVALSEVLHSALLQIAKRENDNDPQHNFFIGLAYLEGIDVEVNHDRALQLITSAAETNEVPEAMEKLVAMYKEGYGVKRDYRVAVEWQQRLVDYWEREYEKSNNKEDCRKLVISLNEISFLSLTKIKDYSAADYNYNRIIELLKQNPDTDTYLILSFLIEYGNYNLLNQHLEKVEKCIPYIEIIIEKLKRKNINVYFAQFQFYLLLGSFFYEKQELDKAEEIYQKGVSLIDFLGNNYDDQVLIIYSKLAMLYDKIDNMVKEEYFLSKSLNLINQQRDEIKNNRLLGVITNTYNLIGLNKVKRGKIIEAEEIINKSIVIGEMLNNREESLDSLLKLASCYVALGYCYIKKNDFLMAEKILHKALEYYNCIMDEAWNPEIQASIIACYGYLGFVYIKKNDLPRAENFYRKQIVILELMVEKSESFLHSLSCAYTHFGSIHDFNGDKTRAEKYYRKAITLQEEIIKTTENIDYLKDLSDSYFKLSKLLSEIGNLTEAEKIYIKSITLNEQIITKIEDSEIHFRLALSYIKLGILSAPYKRDLLEKALQHSITIVTRNPQNEEYSKLKNLLKMLLEQMK